MTRSDIDPAKDAPNSILANFAAIFFGRLFSALSMWLALVILAKLSDPVTVGVYALAQVTCIPISEIAKMGLREIQSSDVDDDFPFGDYLGLRIVATGVALVAMIGAGLLQSDTRSALLVMVVFALARCVEMISDIVYSLFQKHERMDYTGLSLCLTGFLSLGALAIGYLATGSLVGAVLGQLCAFLLVLSFYNVPRARHRLEVIGDGSLRPHWSRAALSRLTLRALPMTIAILMAMVAQILPRLAVERELGLAALGIFAPIMALAMAPDRLVNSLGMAISVRLARVFAAGETRAFLILLGRFVLGVGAFCVVGIAVVALYGDAILHVVYTSDYGAQGELLLLLTVAVSLRLIANVLRFGLIAARCFWWLTVQTVVVAVVAVAACLWLIPDYGLRGASLSVLAIAAAQLVAAAIGLGAVVLSAGRPMTG